MKETRYLKLESSFGIVVSCIIQLFNMEKEQPVEKIQKKIKQWNKNKMFGLNKRMLVVYLIGGLIPSILIEGYLLHGTRNLMMEQYQMAQELVLNTAAASLREAIAVVEDVSKRFYLDEELEHIAFCQYKSMEQLVSDYSAYHKIQEYMWDYPDEIEQITIFVNNDTISENAYFKKITNSVRQKKWYQDALEADGRPVWTNYGKNMGEDKCLTMARLIRDKRREMVGVSVIQMKRERLSEIARQAGGHALLLLNHNTILAVNMESKTAYQVRNFLYSFEDELKYKEFAFESKKYFISSKEQNLGNDTDILQIVTLEEYDSIMEKTGEQGKQGLLLIVCSALVSFGLIWLLSRSVTRRVHIFAGEMEKAANGRFDLKETIGGRDEFTQLYDYLGRMIRDMQRLLTKVYQEQMAKERLNSRQREVEFKMLSSQINPHFLYNTLETIRMKAVVNGQKEIAELVKMLAKIMRRNIQVSNSEVTIQSEITLLEYYLKIQQYRFGDRVKYEILMDKHIGDKKILPLLIQPIVENAVVHGLESKEGKGNIQIRFELEYRDEGEEYTKIYISDNGVGIEEEKLKHLIRDMNQYEELDRTHIGVSNVNQRIHLYYGDEYGLDIKSRQGEGTTIVITVP